MTFTNTTGAPATLELSFRCPAVDVVRHGTPAPRRLAQTRRAGRERERDLQGHVRAGGLQRRSGRQRALDGASGGPRTETTAEKVRNVSPVKINEFRISTGSPANATNSFIELYNAGASVVDISNWTLTEHPTQQAIFSSVRIPAGTRLAAHGFYLLGLSNSGLAAPARKGDTTFSVRSTAGMTAGDTIEIDTGAGAETRKIATLGTEAGDSTTLWQPLPDGRDHDSRGSTNVPVTSAAGFVGRREDRAGYGATYPPSRESTEKYEVATVTAVGKPGTQARMSAARARRLDQHQGVGVDEHLRRRQDPAGHRQRRPRHRDGDGHRASARPDRAARARRSPSR